MSQTMLPFSCSYFKEKQPPIFFFDRFQGIQFYTQIKTVTSQWKAEDATLKSPAVTMPTMGR